ncbi:translation elongation factor-like protein [Candidatus Woesearchaeota archaeon]|nr:translation elongation factor-like protein [Candidatus Woesearchaeota archaeon]
MAEQKIGTIQHYFDNVSVAALKIVKGSLKVGDTIHIKGHTTDFTQKVESMQTEHKAIKEAKKGDDIGIKVSDRVREQDDVFKVTEK